MEYKFCLLSISWFMDVNVQPRMAWSLRNGRKERERLNSVPVSFGKGIWKLPQVDDYIISEQSLKSIEIDATMQEMCLRYRPLRHVWSFCFQLKKNFFWPHLDACRVLVPRPGNEPTPLAGEAQSLKHWTATEDPCMRGFWKLMIKFAKYFVIY